MQALGRRGAKALAELMLMAAIDGGAAAPAGCGVREVELLAGQCGQ